MSHQPPGPDHCYWCPFKGCPDCDYQGHINVDEQPTLFDPYTNIDPYGHVLPPRPPKPRKHHKRKRNP